MLRNAFACKDSALLKTPEHSNTFKHAEHVCITNICVGNSIHCDHCNENQTCDGMHWLVGGQGIVGHTSPLWAG